MWGSGKKSEDPKIEDATNTAPEAAGNAGADQGGIFSNWGTTERAPKSPHPGAANEGMFSNWGSPDKSKDTATSGAEKEGLFSNWGNKDEAKNKADAGAEKDGLFSNWGSKDKPQKADEKEGMFSNWGNKDKPETEKGGMFSDWGKKDEAKSDDKDGLFSNWGNKEKTEDAADKGGMFSDWGSKDKPQTEKEGMFSDWGSKDKPQTEKEGMFSSWGNKDKPQDTAEKGGIFSNLGSKDKPQDTAEKGGIFSNLGSKDKPQDTADKGGIFSNLGSKDKPRDTAEKGGIFSNVGSKDKPQTDKKGLFSDWGNKDKSKNKESKLTDRFPGMQPDPVVENRAAEAPTSNKPWFGGKSKEDTAVDAEKKPGLFDKMLGKDKDKLADEDRSRKSGIFDKKSKDTSEVAKDKKPGLFGRMLRKDKDGKVIEKEAPSEKAGGSNKLPGFLTVGTSRDDDYTSRKKRALVYKSTLTMRTVVKIPLLILILLVAYLCYQYQKAKENSLGSGMSGGTVAEYSEYAFPSQSDWCGHPVNKPKSSRVQPAPLAALIVTNTTVFSKVSDDYDKMIKIFPEMVVANQTKQPGQTAFILCISYPVFVLTIDLKDNVVKLTTLDEPCTASSTFRDAVESAIEKEGDDSFNLGAEAKTDTIPFAVTVNIPKMRAEFVLCKQGSEGCLDPVDFMKAAIDKLNVKKGITDFALVYSDNANTFKSSPKYICEVSQNDVQMCWNPKTYAPVQCFKP